MATFRLIVIVALAHLAALALALLAAMLTPLPAQAQGMCMPWETMRTVLAERYGEVPVGGGHPERANGAARLRLRRGRHLHGGRGGRHREGLRARGGHRLGSRAGSRRAWPGGLR